MQYYPAKASKILQKQVKSCKSK